MACKLAKFMLLHLLLLLLLSGQVEALHSVSRLNLLDRTWLILISLLYDVVFYINFRDQVWILSINSLRRHTHVGWIVDFTDTVVRVRLSKIRLIVLDVGCSFHMMRSVAQQQHLLWGVAIQAKILFHSFLALEILLTSLVLLISGLCVVDRATIIANKDILDTVQPVGFRPHALHMSLVEFASLYRLLHIFVEGMELTFGSDEIILDLLKRRSCLV